MAASIEPNAIDLIVTSNQSTAHGALLQGEILLTTRAYSAWGGAVTAQMYLPLTPVEVWQQLTDYPRWTQYFPDVTHSQVLHSGINASNSAMKRQVKRLYQSASKAFLVFTAQVEIYLKVLETQQQRVQFYLESGSFSDFCADLSLEACGNGTILTYSVQATPTIPVPGILIEQAIRLDLPTNLRQMRRVMCG
ncbi:SRPBCC family protein [Phormidesmis priestleyi]